MRVSGLLGACLLSLTAAVELTGYEFVVVGSGAGGGPLAARLAMAGHKTLLIEAGEDHGLSNNYTVPAYSALASEDEAMAWNFFVRHYADEKRQARDFKTTYKTPSGAEYTGLDPPKDSKMMGTLYPRTGTLGGCTAHNALIALYPHRSDFDSIATLTGDSSWSADNMRKYYARMENNKLFGFNKGHGRKGWYSVEQASLSIPLQDGQLLSMFLGGAFALGKLLKSVGSLLTLLAADANADTVSRDMNSGYYQTPISTEDGSRSGSREFIVAVRDAINKDGSKKYPLDVRMNCHVTKVLFDTTVSPPLATGVEFLDGAFLYKASPRSKTAKAGIKGTAKASREVIIAGGAYNSPQILMLSGVGPKSELQKHKIPVIADLPGVGTNLQDHYEVAVQARVPKDFRALDGCTFGFNGQPDACLDRWENPILGDRGTYASSGLGVAILYKSTATERGEWDVFAFGGPVNFRGYFPQYSINITEKHDLFTWAILKSHPRNTAGTVRLRSSDPLDVPDIVYNYFDTGSKGAADDLQAIFETVGVARKAFKGAGIKLEEVLPGSDVTSQEDIETYIKDTAWGHHASCTCPIGADSDPMAVLDSSFRVRKVQGLRVVDASVYPRIPGTFTAISTYMVGEKAADVIMSQIKS